MEISKIKSNYCTPLNFKGENKMVAPPPKQENVEKNEQKFSKKQVSAIALATALSAATLAGGAIYHGNMSKINKLGKKVTELTSNNEGLQTTLEATEKKVNDLTTKNDTLNKLNIKLEEEAKKVKGQFDALFDRENSPQEILDNISKSLQEKIEKGELDYDVTTPPIIGKGKRELPETALDLPTHAGTTNRSYIQKIDIPEIGADGRFNFEVPMSSEAKITHIDSVDFTPVHKQGTNISEKYADSVQWNNDKIARDVMQNFFDGHGQTLDGVRLNFEPTANGKYKVRIEGKSSYTPDKAVYIGESSKRNDPKAAGNYGEGLKMAVLKLLKDRGAEDVRIASDNWELTYSLEKGNLSSDRVLTYSLDKTSKLNGNYLEFETNDKKLLESLRKTINRFYNSGNEHFKCPDFENEVIGIKNLPKGEKGGIYIAGQRFEFNGSYDGLDNVAIFVKVKPPVDVLDPSRDRISLNEFDLKGIGIWVQQKTKEEDIPKLLKALDGYWSKQKEKEPMAKFLNMILLGAPTWKKGIAIKFPDKFVAYSNASQDIVADLERKGYIVCNDSFDELGMQTISELVGEARKHDVVIPNEIQKKKILVLKEALNKLKPALEKKHFSPDEMDTHIYMFDNTAAKEKDYQDALAEAIIDNRVSKGFWIDKNYLDRSRLADVLETALHELSHKVGGDESAEFSYKLTDVNRDAIAQIINNFKTKFELQSLSSIWDNLNLVK